MDRLNEILKYVNNDINIYIDELKNKYKNQLIDYDYIPTDQFHKMKVGGYVKYIDYRGEYKNGGILVDIIGTDIHKKTITNELPKEVKYSEIILVLKNIKDKKINKMYLQNKYIFYKPHKSKREKFNELFIS